MTEEDFVITQIQAEQTSIAAGAAFQPRTPISNRDLFAGRWDQLITVVDSVSEVGLHVVIYGERGVGKTSMANVIAPLLHAFGDPETGQESENSRLVVKVNANSDDSFSSLWHRAFDEIEMTTVAASFGFSPETETGVSSLANIMSLSQDISIDDVRRILAKFPGSVFVFDEFDRLESGQTRPFTDLIKVLSDYSIDSTVVVVGVSETVDGLIEDHASIVRALIQVQLPRMQPRELQDILDKAQKKLNVQFSADAAKRIIQVSQGLPHYTHLVGRQAVRSACKRLTRFIDTNHVKESFDGAVTNAIQSVRTKYGNATHSAHPEAIYRHVLLACAIAVDISRDDQGFFQAVHVLRPLSKIMGRTVEFSTFNSHLAEYSDDEKRGGVLERRGRPRSYRYRFRDPLMPPYVVMNGLSIGLISDESLSQLLSELPED